MLNSWEEALIKMVENNLKEMEFSAETNVKNYIKVSKTIRDRENKIESKPEMHTCVMSAMGKHGLVEKKSCGYKDLDLLEEENEKHDKINLTFNFKILKIQSKGDYQPDTWQISDPQEKQKFIERCHQSGNGYFK